MAILDWLFGSNNNWGNPLGYLGADDQAAGNLIRQPMVPPQYGAPPAMMGVRNDSGPVPPPFPNAPPMPWADAAKKPMGVFDPRNQLSAGPTSAPDFDSLARASRTIESGSPEGNYSAVGPANKKGQRAYGAYQVMDFNIGPWTKEVLGREMTPQEFLNDRNAQDQVYRAKFGALAQKHGPEGAARAWFTGSPTGTGSDVTGTSADEYVRRFNAARSVAPAARATVGQTAQRWADSVASPSPYQENALGFAQHAQNWGASNPLNNPSVGQTAQNWLNSFSGITSQRPSWYDRNKEWITMASRDLGALGRGMLQAPPGYNAFGQGFANVVDDREKRIDTDLKRRLMRAEIGIKETSVQQREALQRIASSGDLPQALRLIAGLGDAGKFVDAFMKLDPATQQVLAQNEAVKTFMVESAKLKAEYAPDVIAGKAELEGKKKIAELSGSQQFAKESGRLPAAQEAAVVLPSFDMAIRLAKDPSFSASGLPYSAFGGFLRGGREMDAALTAIKSNLTFSKLGDLRAQSPTGGALGQVSDMEGKLLASTLAGLDPGAGAQALTRNLRTAREMYKDMIEIRKLGQLKPLSDSELNAYQSRLAAKYGNLLGASPESPAPPPGFRTMR